MQLSRVQQLASEALEEHIGTLQSNRGVFAEFPVAEQDAHLEEMRQVKRLLDGLLSAELARRELHPRPPRHSILSQKVSQGPIGVRFSFARHEDLTAVNPAGSRGWFTTEEECVAAMWEDHDEMAASPKTTYLLHLPTGEISFEFRFLRSRETLLKAQQDLGGTPLVLPDSLWVRANTVFGAPAKALLWFLRENRGLGRRPLDLINEGRAQEVGDVLDRIENGIPG